jgi:hypothetical protein
MSAGAAQRYRSETTAHSTGRVQPSRRRISPTDPPPTGRGLGPRSRPAGLSGPFVSGPGLRGVRACTAEAAAHAAPLRLTQRGTAVILVAALMLLVSAVVVIGLTAVRVTGPNYVPYGQSSLVER